MKEYKVSFRIQGGLNQIEIVKAETIFKAEQVIKDKYGVHRVKISTVASMNNVW